MDHAANLFPFVVDGVHVLPILHERLEYADLARVAIDRLEPDAVAVEVPSCLDRVWRRAVGRLPAISVLLYENERDETIYLPVHPGDALVEAARRADERGIEVRCADLDVDGYADYRDPVPDSYAVLRLGAARLYDHFRRLGRPRDADDDRREACMAYHAAALRRQGARRVLLLCGMHHAEGVARQLAREQAVPLTRAERRNVRLVHLDPASLGEVLPEIPFHVATYEIRRKGLPGLPPEAPPRQTARDHGPFRVLSGGRPDDEAALAGAFARAAHDAGSGTLLDRLKLQQVLLREAERQLSTSAPDEDVRPWQRLNLARFSRNLALRADQLVPGLFDLLVAARGCVSDNFAWEVHRLATAYPAQTGAAADLPTARIRADEMYDGTRRVRLRRMIRRSKRPDWKSVLGRGRGRERWPGEWIEGFEGEAICSYPPEDVVIEDFGDYLRRRGKNVLSEERSRTVPFTTSVLDGIDVRETIRHWAERRIYVRELGRAPGNVGSVVVVFDDEEDRYPHCQTWIGEHNQESDMAFFCTDPARAIVGPGICRVTYGGFLMSYPPRRMADVWTDPDYRMAESRAEVLLLAALDYCAEKIVVHVAARPPRPVMHQVAARFGLKILHVPIGTISPSTVRRIRVMHILSGHDKRRIAKEYTW